MPQSRLMRVLALLLLSLILAVEAGGEPMILEGVDRYRVIDPLFECARIVLAYRGEHYTPEYVQGISGAAFRIAGPCPCAPPGSAAMDTKELIELLGYECEHIDLIEETDPESVVREKVVEPVREQIRAGRPAIVWHAFTNAEWDVVCGFDEETGQFIGRGSYKGVEEYAREGETRTAKCLHICPALGAILVREKVGELDARRAELNALEEAVRHAHSPKDRFLAEIEEGEIPFRMSEGLATFDRWARAFREDPQRVPDGPGDRYPLGVYHSTHAAAPTFLRAIADNYPKGRSELGAAAGHFDAEANALDELYNDVFGCWEGYQEPDPDRARRTVELLTKAKDEYAKGIDGILAALEKIDPQRARRAKMRARIEGEDDSVRIEGVPKLEFGRALKKWGHSTENTFCGALEGAMRFSGHPYTYSDLMGLSALAFRLRWCNDETATKWCPSAPIGEMPDEQIRIRRLTGWQLPMKWLEPEGRDNDALAKEIVAEIDAGRQVPAYPPVWNVAAIYGYEDDGHTLLVNSYDEQDLPYRLPIEKLGPQIHYLGEYSDPPPLKDCLADTLRAAVYHWRRGKHDGGLAGREYFYGDAAFAAWIRDLQRYDEADADVRAGIEVLDPWNYVSLYDARRAAARFLRDWRVLTEGRAREALDRAIELYEKEHTALEPLLPVKHDAENSDRAFAPEKLKKEIAILKNVRELERRAVAAIEDALKAGVITTDLPEGHDGADLLPPVILDEAVAAFAQISPTGTHEALVDGDVYVQHYVYLSGHWLLMKTAGWDEADFDTIAAVSGASALFGYEPGSFMPKYAHAHIGMSQRIADATGFGFEWLHFDGVQGAWQLIQESINSGRPMLGWHWENVVFAGYHDADDPGDRLVFAIADGPETYARWWTWDELAEWADRFGGAGLGRHTGRIDPKPPREVALRVMRDLVDWSAEPPQHILQEYPNATFGLAGMLKYADDCEDVEAHEEWVVCHPTNPQTLIRNCTAEYLADVARSGVFAEEITDRIAAAADRYEQAYAAWKDLYELLGHGATDEMRRDAACRSSGADLVRRAVEHEREAVNELKKVLAGMQ